MKKIPIWTLCPICNSDIDIILPSLELTVAVDGKHPPPLGAAVVVVVIGGLPQSEHSQCPPES